MNTVKHTYSFGMGFFQLLAAIFITLKLAGIGVVSNWSWIWVLSPLWAPIAALFMFAFVVFLFVYIADKF